MTVEPALVVVGASLAGAKAAEGARAAGFDGRVVLVGAEAEAPYERPPLSKAVLRGEAAPETTRVHDDGFYKHHDIELLTGRTVEGLDPGRRHVRLDGNEALPFTVAVLATGAEPRRIDVPGADLAASTTCVTWAMPAGWATPSATRRRVAVIGGGWIGSEAAASARQMGADVVLVDAARCLCGVLGDEVGEVFRRLHADNGVKLRLSSGVVELRGHRTVQGVVLPDGDVEPADVVIVGVGVTPRVGLAAEAGLHLDDGIAVDEHLESSAPGVYAAGDVASAWHPHYHRRLRVEHWANALNQGLVAAPTPPVPARAYTGCRTSSPISTTSAWSTSGTATRVTPSSSAEAWRTASSSPSGTATASSPPP